MNQAVLHVNALAEHVGEQLGPSAWHVVDQARLDEFAELTGDRQWIHTDPVAAADGPFGGIVVQGYLLLALIPVLVDGIVRIDGVAVSVNRGLDRVRFLAPVRPGDRIRGRATIVDVARTSSGTAVRLRLVIEVEGRRAAACHATILSILQEEDTGSARS